MISKPKIFIGSSKGNVAVANAIATGLEQDRDCAFTTVWSEGVFQPGDSFLDRLLDAPSEYDFAVMVWAADDKTDTDGVSQPSPRDNVVFECGLFMGALGKKRVFVVYDSQADIKIPSDFAGNTPHLVGSVAKKALQRPKGSKRIEFSTNLIEAKKVAGD